MSETNKSFCVTLQLLSSGKMELYDCVAANPQEAVAQALEAFPGQVVVQGCFEGSSLEPRFVAYSAGEEVLSGQGFWCSFLGWTGFDFAQKFSLFDICTRALPAALSKDCRWVSIKAIDRRMSPA